MTTAAPQVAQGVALLAAIIGGERRAARHAPMLAPGARCGKYYTVHAALSDRQLAAHLAGHATYAGVLVDRDGLAAAGVIELDHGSDEAAGRVRAAAQALGVRMFSIVVRGAGDHDGSHSWALFAERAAPERIKALMQAVVAAAGLPAETETWPNDVNIRLPFGVHTHSRRRGRYVDTADHSIDLDGADGVARALEAVCALEPNGPPPELPPPEPEAAIEPVPRQAIATAAIVGGGPRAAGVRDLIASFNNTHPIEDLLRSYGATQLRDGWACGCGVAHTHETQLAVLSGGRAVFFSPRCRWAPGRTGRNGRPVADSFDLFTTVEHRGDKAAALRALRAAAPRAPRNYPPTPDELDRQGGGEPQAEARRRDAKRKRAARRDEAAATLQAVRDRAAEDGQLAPCERAVLHALLECAGERDWCRPSKARLCELSGYALGSVKRALMRLEARGYIASQGDGGRSNDTAIRTFLRGSSPATEEPPFLRGSSAAATDAPFLRGSSPGAEAGRSYVDHAGSPVIHESIGMPESDSYHWAGEAGGGSSTAGDDEDAWAALLATTDAAPPPIDPQALDAWELHEGLCATGSEAAPVDADEDPAEAAAVEADVARVLAYREQRSICRQARESADSGCAVSFPGGASFDPAACRVAPVDLAEHWAQLDRARAQQEQEQTSQPPAAVEVQASLVIVPRAQIDPEHRRRIDTLTSKAHFCRHKARVAASRAQRRWARQEAERLFQQLRSLRAEQVAVPPELAHRGPLTASWATAPMSRSAPSPALAVVQGELFTYAHETSIGGLAAEQRWRGG
jgi:hypothetical protein